MKSVWFLLYEDFQLLDVCGPLQVFASANDELRARGKHSAYDTQLYSTKNGFIGSSSGVSLSVSRLPDNVETHIDIVIAPGGCGLWTQSGPRLNSSTQNLVDWVRKASPQIRNLCSVCTGAFLLAFTGLLDGRKVVTHWLAYDSLRLFSSDINVDQNAIYVRDGDVWTSAGVTAGIDLALALVQNDLGTEITMAVARKLVVFYKRPGGQSQFSGELLGQCLSDERITNLYKWARARLHVHSFSVQDLAEYSNMTPRTFNRYFLKQTGGTPARALERMRVEKACSLLESRKLKAKVIADHCGFTSAEIMRRAFLRSIGVSPSDYQKRFSVNDESRMSIEGNNDC
ncbi:HTH-type transcriptional regulator CdhR [Pseudomonas fluorescens]|uniref:HTH-type transcriptional regulator CdhR n=1 Tax=Pseudomonas fluorescens TaxID=294 RepID=A0A5E6REE4_PSEFL|nr:DJ-1/PfpI family protein [Pseudomonas fluorescens]VVM67344.1 HTH-type transcriptional regulator CdhR [Pseudomonas fluorescens]